MINAVSTTIPQPDGSDRYVIIEPMLEKDGEMGLRSTGVFKIFKDSFTDQTELFTEPRESDEDNNDLPDDQNPDYLGKFVFNDGRVEHFEGNVLRLAEQAYLVVFIESYQEPDISL